MQLLVIILNKTEMLKDVMCAMVEAGITKATTVDSEGMGRFLAYEIPIFAGLRQLVGESKSYNKMIISITEDRDIVLKLTKVFKEIDLDFSKPDTGIIFTVPVNAVVKSD